MSEKIWVLMIETLSDMLDGYGKNDPEKGELQALIERNLHVPQKKNMDRHLKMSMNPFGKIHGNAEQKVFRLRSFRTKPAGFKVFSIKRDTAKVTMEQETRKLSGDNFTDTPMTAVHTLYKKMVSGERPEQKTFAVNKLRSSGIVSAYGKWMQNE